MNFSPLLSLFLSSSLLSPLSQRLVDFHGILDIVVVAAAIKLSLKKKDAKRIERERGREKERECV